MIPSLLSATIAVLLYAILTAWQKKLNLLEYMTTNKTVLGISAGVLFLLSMFGKTALMLAVLTFLVPYIVSYSVPSLVAKVVDIWGVVVAWFKSKA